MKKTFLAIAALAVAAPVATAPVIAADMGQHIQTVSSLNLTQASEYRKRDYNRGYNQGRRDQRLSSNSQVWRDKRDGRYYCKRDNGTTGLLIGAGVGGLAGHTIAGNGDKTLGAILGAAGGALLGREIDRDKYRCR